jgi:hypothetical protein
MPAQPFLGEQHHPSRDGQRALTGEPVRNHEPALPFSLTHQRLGSTRRDTPLRRAATAAPEDPPLGHTGGAHRDPRASAPARDTGSSRTPKAGQRSLSASSVNCLCGPRRAEVQHRVKTTHQLIHDRRDALPALDCQLHLDRDPAALRDRDTIR